MKNNFPVVQTINANQILIAASPYPADWKARKQHHDRIEEYGRLTLAKLKELGAEIIEVKN